MKKYARSKCNKALSRLVKEGVNPERREVWRDIQAEERKLRSRWSFRDKLERELIARWSFKKDCTDHELGQSVAGKRKGAFG